jgi:hypothetical protein
MDKLNKVFTYESLFDLASRDNTMNTVVLRVFELSGFVARNLSGCHSALKEGRDEADGAVTGDPEDEI